MYDSVEYEDHYEPHRRQQIVTPVISKVRQTCDSVSLSHSLPRLFRCPVLAGPIGIDTDKAIGHMFRIVPKVSGTWLARAVIVVQIGSDVDRSSKPHDDTRGVHRNVLFR